MSDGRSGRDKRRSGRWRQHRPDQPLRHDLDLAAYLDELASIRGTAEANLAAAGEQALKALDRFLANLANNLGMDNDRAGLGDSIRYLERSPMPDAREIAARAERYRDTRNALAHNPDVMLRPEAATRIIDGVEEIVRMAATGIAEVAHRAIVTARADEPLPDARDRMLDHHYDQLVVVDRKGKLVDLLTDRDIVVAEAREDIDADGNGLTVGETIGMRGYRAAGVLSRRSAASEAIDLLRDERIAAVVVTENGKVGEAPLGIITRGDILKTS